MTATSETIHRTLKDFFGFDSFKGDQEQIIRSLIEGKDCFVLMPTGGGKSLCYQLPALLLPGTAIVVSPLIALMKNQVDAIRGFVTGNEGIAHFLNSSLSKAQISEVREDLMSGVTKLLYVAPESLTKEENVAILKEIRMAGHDKICVAAYEIRQRIVRRLACRHCLIAIYRTGRFHTFKGVIVTSANIVLFS